VTSRGWILQETIGIGIPNPRPVVRIPIPKDLTPEQLDRLDAMIDHLNMLAEIDEEWERLHLSACWELK
jgi:hypothetical protein